MRFSMNLNFLSNTFSMLFSIFISMLSRMGSYSLELGTVESGLPKLESGLPIWTLNLPICPFIMLVDLELLAEGCCWGSTVLCCQKYIHTSLEISHWNKKMHLEQKREKWQLKWWLEFVNAIYNMFLFIIRSVCSCSSTWLFYSLNWWIWCRWFVFSHCLGICSWLQNNVLKLKTLITELAKVEIS